MAYASRLYPRAEPIGIYISLGTYGLNPEVLRSNG